MKMMHVYYFQTSCEERKKEKQISDDKHFVAAKNSKDSIQRRHQCLHSGWTLYEHGQIPSAWFITHCIEHSSVWRAQCALETSDIHVVHYESTNCYNCIHHKVYNFPSDWSWNGSAVDRRWLVSPFALYWIWTVDPDCHDLAGQAHHSNVSEIICNSQYWEMTPQWHRTSTVDGLWMFNSSASNWWFLP